MKKPTTKNTHKTNLNTDPKTDRKTGAHRKLAPKRAEKSALPVRQTDDEVRVAGVHAAHATFKARPDDIIRVYVEESRVKEFGPLLSACAKARKAYHILDSEALDKVAGTTHHEGVCLVARRRLAPPLDELAAQKTGVILLLEGVANPHNVGAILRVAAFFGAHAVLVVGKPQPISAAVYRTAEGGAEFVPLLFVPTVSGALSRLAEDGWKIWGTAGRSKHTLWSKSLPERVVLVFGSEREGMSRAAVSACERVVSIPGTGHLDSLNVSCAASTVLGEYRRLWPLADVQVQ